MKWIMVTKKLYKIILCLLLIMCVGCQRKEFKVRTIYSDIYTEEEIQEAIDIIKKEFSKDKLQGEYAYSSGFQAQAESASTFTSDFEYTVPKGKYLVLGDNRLISKDSRMFGLVDKDMIQGKVVFRYWPLSEIKII